MKKLILVLCCVALVVAFVSCSMKAPAQAAVKAGEEALNAVKEEALKYIPEQYRAVEKILNDAKAAMEKGDYKTAIETAKLLPGKAQELVAAIEARKAELPGIWGEMAKALPKLIADTKAAVAKAKGADKASKATAAAGIKEMEANGMQAEAECKNNNLVEAVNLGEQIKSKAQEIQGLLSSKMAGK